MPKRNLPKKSYKARAIGMIGASITMGALTVASVKHGINETIRLKQDRQRFEQKMQQSHKKFTNSKIQIEKQRQKEIQDYRLKSNKKISYEESIKLKAQASAFKIKPGMSFVQVEEFVKKNFDHLRSNSKKGISRTQVEINKKYYGGILKKECEKYDFDYSLAVKILEGESSWNPKAISSKGAVGLFQIMPDNYVRSKKYAHNPLDPEQNIKMGVKILNNNLKLFNGDVRKTVAAYNYGSNAVIRIVKKYGVNWEQNSFGMHRYVKKIVGK